MSDIAISGRTGLFLKPRSRFAPLAGGPPTETTQNFSTYGNGTLLSTHPGWSVLFGEFVVIAGGSITGLGGSQNGARYQPAGFTTAANHESEVTLLGAADGGGSAFHGPMAAMQASGAGYFLAMDNNGFIYFGFLTAGGVIEPSLNLDTGAGIPAGSKLRLVVGGIGATRVVTGSYDIGGGWVTPAAWLNKDWGATGRFDGGYGGVFGYGGGATVKIDSLTIRNLP